MRTIVTAVAALSAIMLAPTAHADNIDFGTNQDACQAAAHQSNASGDSSAFCFETGPGHYSLTYTRR